MNFLRCLGLLAFVVLCVSVTNCTAQHKGPVSTAPQRPDLSLPRKCSRLVDYAPSLPSEADELFQAARALEQRGNLSPDEKKTVAEGYRKAADMGHWKAMKHLMDSYLNGTCTPKDRRKARELADQLIALNVGSGWYGRYILELDAVAKDDYLHLAADYGDPDAQRTLGMRYLNPLGSHPPLPPEADRIFTDARALEKQGSLSPEEWREVFEGYEKAAEMGHWKGIHNLMVCYMYGYGTDVDFDKVRELAGRLIALNVGRGWYVMHTLYKNGLGVPEDAEQAEICLRKAADLGDSDAQEMLGDPEQWELQGLRYLVCAVRQGDAQAALDLGIELSITNNYYMAAEYFYRAAALGEGAAACGLSRTFQPSNDPNDVEETLGFQPSDELAKVFNDYCKVQEKQPGIRIPDLFKKHPLPKNTVMSREQSRAQDHSLKRAFGGKWPDEIYPDLAPDYLPPEL